MSGPFGSSAWMYNSGGSFYDYPIDQSVRLDSATTAYFSRTPSSASNRQNWTISMWIKRSDLEFNLNNDVQYLFSAVQDNNNYCGAFFNEDNRLTFWQVSGGAVEFRIQATMLFRDPSAWYHLVFQSNTTNGTASDRMKIYVNGERVTDFTTTTYPNQNANWFWNNTYGHAFAAYTSFNRSFDGYMAEVHAVDGSALDPTSFGEYKSGVWIPKEYTGSYGTNGFHLEFANSGSLGADTSGNSNNWTANNLAATDQVLDSPTNNFATLNWIAPSGGTFSEGNLAVYGDTGTTRNPRATMALPDSGKWYWEFRLGGNSGGYPDSGIYSEDFPLTGTYTGNYTAQIRPYAGGGNTPYWVIDGTDLYAQVNGTAIGSGTILQHFYDADNRKFWMGINGTYYGISGGSTVTVSASDIANGTNPAYTVPAGVTMFAGISIRTTEVHKLNFGQDSTFAGATTAGGNTDANGLGDFKYPVIANYLALCTANLSVAEGVDPAEDKSPQDYFNISLYTGNGTSSQSITGLGFQPDWVWIKTRSVVDNHVITDAVRGINSTIYSNNNEAAGSATTLLQSFDSDGFTVGSDSSVNGSGRTIVGWSWLAGNGTSSNTSGSITSTVSANPAAGFSIVKWTGTGSSSTIGHGLNSTPELIINKNLSAAENWVVYSIAQPNGSQYLRLNQDSVLISDSSVFGAAPTSSVFTVGSNPEGNGNGNNHIAYCFHSVDGFSKVGTYVGNSSDNGPFIYTGFRVAYLLVKRAIGPAGQEWSVYDDTRSKYNETLKELYPNRNWAEGTDSRGIDLLSNGFKPRRFSDFANNSNSTYLYYAVAENPFKYALAR